jgi:hypothetical protein
MSLPPGTFMPAGLPSRKLSPVSPTIESLPVPPPTVSLP